MKLLNFVNLTRLCQLDYTLSTWLNFGNLTKLWQLDYTRWTLLNKYPARTQWETEESLRKVTRVFLPWRTLPAQANLQKWIYGPWLECQSEGLPQTTYFGPCAGWAGAGTILKIVGVPPPPKDSENGSPPQWTFFSRKGSPCEIWARNRCQFCRNYVARVLFVDNFILHRSYICHQLQI